MNSTAPVTPHGGAGSGNIAPPESDALLGYVVVLPAFHDGDGDGIGDVTGLISHLGYLELLGVDGVDVIGAPDDSWTAALQRHGLVALTAPDRPADLGAQPFDADRLRVAIRAELAGGPAPTWTLSTAGDGRLASRWDDRDLGERRARAGLLVVLALPGRVRLLQGDELGLPVFAVPDGPYAESVRPFGRPDVLVPMPWDDTEPGTGFSVAGGPAPAFGHRHVVAAQLESPTSTLTLLRHAVEERSHRPSLPPERIEWYGAPDHCFAFRGADGGIICVLNTGPHPVPLPPGDPILTSVPLDDLGRLPGDAAAWLAPVP
ncbi:hypothetical protein GIS00_05870 [Nakamurella sp. YIM 132087]|uniref:DUF3459 domain-containing protein n=1 Tax=Nakamurella alba TaxID=2665158 RepID=A0A7K1FH67_9ACTN|nr:hypothetical protein [Nakamurella alba]MTD13471.1 hypothetical protein [Nakamurella alba]